MEIGNKILFWINPDILECFLVGTFLVHEFPQNIKTVFRIGPVVVSAVSQRLQKTDACFLFDRFDLFPRLLAGFAGLIYFTHRELFERNVYQI